MYPHSRRTLAIASLATLATFLDTTILYVAFPDIASTFNGASTSTLSWVLNAYTIVFGALLISAGKLADRVGHRRIFLAGSTVFTLASVACGLAPTVEVLIVFRILQAVGAAGLVPSSLALVIHAFAHDQLPRAVAIWGVAGAVAGALGPTLGGAIVATWGWRWVFFINLPVGVYTVVDGWRHLRESADRGTRVPSVIGVVLIAGAAGLSSYAVVGSETYGWLGVHTIGAVTAGVVMLVAFVLHQRGATAPVLDLDLFTVANFRWSVVTMLLFGGGFSAYFFGSILFLTDVWDSSILRAGFDVAPGPIVVGLVAPVVGRLAGRIGQRPVLLVGGALFAISGAHRLVVLGSEVDYVLDYLPSMVVSGLGVAFVFPQLASIVAQAFPPERAGVAGAALQAVRQFGGTFGVALTVALLGVSVALSERLGAFDQIWWVMVIAGAGTSALVLPMRTGARAPHGVVPDAPETAV